MSSIEILDIFYNSILKEAAVGSIDCFFKYNIGFSTEIKELCIDYNYDSNDNELLIPTLKINDTVLFNILLLKYVNMAKQFYTDDNYVEEVLNNEDGSSIEKQIMTLLWSNATYEDFENPINYLRKRINYLTTEIPLEDNTNLGYSEVLGGNVIVSVEKESMVNETPYSLNIELSSESETYHFPKLRFGVSDDEIYFYAIQNGVNDLNKYSKKVNRNLYKIGHGFDKTADNKEIYDLGNLNDVTPSFVVAADLGIWLFEQLGYTTFNIVSLLPVRWNAKRISNIKKSRNNLEMLNNLTDEQLRIQSNLTEKFIRTFSRIVYHHPDLTINYYPFEYDSNLKIKVSDKTEKSNNELLEEIKDLVNNCKLKQKRM